ncbi:cobaltochelatase subunit CobN [Jannaschia pohangensis]|uniref:magnesium chelatase n=1 Tax=Jannaschia pohangensis TaxID=390807 RepID=A0A1I3UQ32_9RHOB|nr:cobaltochelatase subunit CobN [Jannaschia pohangensis]SFJ85464.1 cobaltochelatase CobN subunit [Jannaschia pohangensis]
MRDDVMHTPYRVVVVTLDRHIAGPASRSAPVLEADFPGLQVSIHAAAEWGKDAAALDAARRDIAQANIIVTSVLFLEDHVNAILPDLLARRPACDAMVNIVCDQAIVQLTKMGDLDMSRPASGAMALLKKLKPSKTAGKTGKDTVKMLRRLPKLLRLIPGKAQDLRAWFLSMQYWLGGSDENIDGMVRFLLSRYARRADWRGVTAPLPIEYPELGLYHPDLPGKHIVSDIADLPVSETISDSGSTIGIVMLRSYILASDTAHYDHVIRRFEAAGHRVLPVFAGGLDARPAVDAYLAGKIDALVSLTGFSLVGGPAYNDSEGATAMLAGLDVPYVAAQPLEFQTLQEWATGAQGLSPIEATILVALPEIDGATNPTVFAGRHGPDGCSACKMLCTTRTTVKAMAPCPERIDALVDKTTRLAALRRKKNADKTVAIVLFGFPPNAGAIGTAAYLSVFESLFNTLHRMAADGYDLTPPETVDDLREAVLKGNAAQYGQEANIAATVSADQIVARTPWLDEIEEVWGPAPGRIQSNGREVYVLGATYGKVFVGVQPTFGYEGDPMRLLFERGFAPTHAFNAFYQYLRHDLNADAVLHFGMHGALEFMPGKQVGLCGADWPDRLMGNMPNIYLYAANNPSEATLAKRRTNAVTVTYLTPPLQNAGLYRGLSDLKDSLARWRETTGDRSELEELIAEQAAAVDLSGAPETLWLRLLETEEALIPEGLHIVGKTPSPETVEATLNQMTFADAEARARARKAMTGSHELDGLARALSARFIAPVPGGDVIRAPEILPTGRNIHAFDPFRMPTAFAMRDGAKQADALLATHDGLPRSVALVLWGSDNIKSNGGPIAQALALMGCTPRFDAHGRLCGADLVSLETLGRARVDVVMTLSGIFRDLLPLQTKLLADAALKCAMAEEPAAMNPIREHALAHMARSGCDMTTAALRVFSNAEGAYGANVNQLVDSSAFDDDGDLADAYQARKSFAYGTDGEASAQPALLQDTLATVDLAYQNLESIELGVTTVDHYFDTLGGIAAAVKRARGGQEPAIYIGDQTRGQATVRTLADQVALETRSRNLNPKYYEPLLQHGHEGVRQIEANITNTLGWSATTGKVEPWVYARLTETFVLDDAMRKRLADLSPQASMRMANRLLEASDRNYWQPDAATLAALQDAADAIEDQLEGVAAE